MIPDFKTYIGESVWADMHRRSNGDHVRKEDDVNHMNFDTFADYIKDNYSEKGDWFSIVESSDEKSRHIEIDIISGIDLSFNVVDGKIYNILIQSGNKYVDVPGLKKIFNVNILGRSTFSVVEKNWTKSNNTFVKLIEFFLKKKTNESVWADIHKRSNGEQERKEDIINVNAMDPTEFYKYLIDTYETKDVPNYLYGIKMSSTFNYIDVPVLQSPDEDTIICSVDYEYFTNNKKLTMSYYSEMCFPELFAKMKEVYDVKSVSHTKAVYNKKTTIKPLDGSECTNSFFINVIEFILKNGPKERIILSHK